MKVSLAGTVVLVAIGIGAPATAQPVTVVRNDPVSVIFSIRAWRRDAARAAVVETAVIDNRNPFPVQDLLVLCTHAKFDGEVLGQISRPFPGMIGPRATHAVAGIATGFVVEDGAKVTCKVERYARQTATPTGQVAQRKGGPGLIIAPKAPPAQAQPAAPPAPLVDETNGENEAACARWARLRVPSRDSDIRDIGVRYSHRSPPRVEFASGRVIVDRVYYNVTVEVVIGDKEFTHRFVCERGPEFIAPP